MSLSAPTCYPPNPKPTAPSHLSYHFSILWSFRIRLCPYQPNLLSPQPWNNPPSHPISSRSYQGLLPDSQDCAALFFKQRIFSILQHPSQCQMFTLCPAYKSVSNLLEMSFGIFKTKYCSPVSLLIVSSPWDEDRHVSSKSVLTADCSAAKIFLLLVLQKVRSE